MSMSTFATQDEYWRERAVRAEKLLGDVQCALMVYEKVGNIKLPILDDINDWMQEEK
jgi:hypothetical protein